ncbi:MAG: RIP metalloprotease RseP [Tannerella sp.]|jgi:regulator of sigma E protease|nr:RIP metalloprotease RseP [Tannerella sp.]
METFFIKAIQLILSLSILVLVHEFGHFLFARIFKVRVEKFYLFFDPWFSLFKFKPKNGETEYGVGWLPLGGYCKISGMIDESMDKEQLAQPPQPYEFRSKPAGPRLMIMVAGVVFNFLLALFIYSMVLFTWGDTYVPLKNVKMGMAYSDTFKKIGFCDGDILLNADNKELVRFGADAFRAVINAKEITVLRDGETVTIPIPDDIMQRVMQDKQGFAAERFPMVIDKVMDDLQHASAAVLRHGDSIVSVNRIPTPSYFDVVELLQSNKGQTVELGFYREGNFQDASIQVDSLGVMGVYPMKISDIYETVTIRYGFLESFPAGIMLGVNTLKGYVSDMKYVFTKEGVTSLGGFGAIGNLFPAVWHWRTFWMMTAFLSIILAFMNILPIPALDGGHVLFLLYEVITRRKPSDKFLEYAQIAGMVILIALLIYANGNDIFNFFFKK